MTDTRSPLLLIDDSCECARSVRRLSGMTRVELESFLDATARASATVIVVPARRAKPKKSPRAPRWRR